MAEIDVEIDDLGNSVIHHVSGEVFPTSILRWADLLPDQTAATSGWRFEWQTEVAQKQRLVVALIVRGTADVQGLMSLEPFDGYVQVHLVESAPHNVGRNKLFRGVPANLFGFACALSFRLGYAGFVGFEAKTILIPHYQVSLGAQRIGSSSRMIIIEEAANRLLERYYLKEEDRWPL